MVLDNVVKTFGNKRAVDGLTMSVDPGTVLAFLGPNGAGKTTTIEMCEGFVTPTSGEIRVLGMNPANDAEAVRERIGIMLQEGGSYNGARVHEMLQLSASYNQNPHDPDWLLSLLGLEGVRNTTYRRLSGGQKQRLSLAMALISRPELVFLDEPTAGMDAQSRLAMWDLIRALRTDGVTVILTTHLMDEAEALADDVVIIDHGRIVAQGSPAELTAAAHGADDLVTFSTDKALPEGVIDLREFNTQVVATQPLHYRVDAPASPQLLAAITTGAAEAEVLVRELAVSHRNLEEVFLEITGRELRS